MKHVGNASCGTEVAAVLAEDAADLCGGAILVVGRRFDDQGDSAGPIALVHDLLNLRRVDALTGAAFDRALDVIVGHALRARCLDGAAQSRVAVRIAATALGGNADFLRQLAKNLTALGVDRAFKSLDLRSEEHTSELQSRFGDAFAVFC